MAIPQMQAILSASKICTTCHLDHPLSRFSKMRSAPDGMRYTCKGCDAIYALKWREEHREYAREQEKLRKQRMTPEQLEHKRQHDLDYYRSDPEQAKSRILKRLFGITIEDYNEMLTAQGGRCAICGATESDASGRKLAVDHHHGTGKVRGLLCAGCNNGLGRFKDDPELLARAITYLLEST